MDPDPAWIAAAVALASAIAGLAAWGLKKAWKVLRQVSHFLDDWKGEPARDGLAARPGVMARLGNLEDTVAAVHLETQANHGTSLRDVVNRTAADVAGIKTEQEAVRRDLDQVRGRPRAKETQ